MQHFMKFDPKADLSCHFTESLKDLSSSLLGISNLTSLWAIMLLLDDKDGLDSSALQARMLSSGSLKRKSLGGYTFDPQDIEAMEKVIMDLGQTSLSPQESSHLERVRQNLHLARDGVKDEHALKRFLDDFIKVFEIAKEHEVDKKDKNDDDESDDGPKSLPKLGKPPIEMGAPMRIGKSPIRGIKSLHDFMDDETSSDKLKRKVGKMQDALRGESCLQEGSITTIGRTENPLEKFKLPPPRPKSLREKVEKYLLKRGVVIEEEEYLLSIVLDVRQAAKKMGLDLAEISDDKLGDLILQFLSRKKERDFRKKIPFVVPTWRF